MNYIVEEVELLAYKEGNYTLFVFKILKNNELLMCTKLPNWEHTDINIGEIGYLQYFLAIQGEEYYDPNADNYKKYNYSNVYYNKFIRKSEDIKNNKIIL